MVAAALQPEAGWEVGHRSRPHFSIWRNIYDNRILHLVLIMMTVEYT